MRRGWPLGFALAAAASCATPHGGGDDSRLDVWIAKAQKHRELTLTQPVQFEQVHADDVPKLIREELSAAVSREQAERMRDAYAALGVLPRDIDLLEAQLELHTETIAGLYSPQRRTLFVLDAVADSSAADVIVVHEVVHALQHQHFPDTVELMMALRRNDDVQLAIAAELEGDATLTMLADTPLRRGPDAAEAMHEAMRSELAKPDSATASLPLLLRASLFFPYGAGTVYAASRFAKSGNAGLDDALRDPPLSTAHVLDPERAVPVDFVRLPVAELAGRLAPRACRAGDDNVAGVLTLDVLLTPLLEPGARAALAQGWRGDRFAQISCGDVWELVWLTLWDSPASAERFAREYHAVAPAVAANAPLSGVPTVVTRDRTALVISPGAHAHADWLLDASEVRSYADFTAWRADDCFPESPCPSAAR